MMTSEQTLVSWMTILFLVTGFFLAGVWLRDWIHKRTRPDPLAPDEVCSKPEYKAERFSSRREK